MSLHCVLSADSVDFWDDIEYVLGRTESGIDILFEDYLPPKQRSVQEPKVKKETAKTPKNPPKKTNTSTKKEETAETPETPNTEELVVGTIKTVSTRSKNGKNPVVTVPLINCEKCEMTFSNDRQREVHSKVHVRDQLKCKECDEIFDNAEALNEHVDEKHKEKFVCYVSGCTDWYWSYNGLKGHMRKQHGISPEYKCQKCTVTYKTKAARDKHMDSCTGVACKLCKELVPSQDDMMLHLINCTKNQECKICFDTFQSRMQLKEHLSQVHKRCDMVCENCHTNFRNFQAMEAHKQKQLCEDTVKKAWERAKKQKKR